MVRKPEDAADDQINRNDVVSSRGMRSRSPAIRAISGLTTCTSRLIDSPHCELSKYFVRFVSAGASIAGCPRLKQGQEHGIARDKVASASFNTGLKDLY